MATIFRIKQWQKLYETHETKKYKRLGWIKSPCDLQSTGLSIIREHDDAAGIIGVWVLLRKYAASREAPRDGVIGRIDSPLSLRAIAIAIGLPEQIVVTAMPILVSVGWIEEIKTGDFREISGRQPENTGGKTEDTGRKTGSTLTLTPTLRDREETEDEEKEPEVRKELSSPSGSRRAKKTSASDDPIAEVHRQCVADWNRERSARQCDHWPEAKSTSAVNLSDLRARVKQCGGVGEFGPAFAEALRRAASGYARPIDGSSWRPSLPWLLTANGWRKASAYADPGPLDDVEPEPIFQDNTAAESASAIPFEDEPPMPPEKAAEYESRIQAIKAEADAKRRKQAEEQRIIDEWKKTPLGGECA